MFEAAMSLLILFCLSPLAPMLRPPPPPVPTCLRLAMLSLILAVHCDSTLLLLTTAASRNNRSISSPLGCMSPLPDEKFSAFLQPSTAGLISLSRSESVLSDLCFFCCSITRSYLICFFLRDRKLNLSNAALSIEDGFDEVVTFCAMTPQKALDARMWKMF